MHQVLHDLAQDLDAFDPLGIHLEISTTEFAVLAAFVECLLIFSLGKFPEITFIVFTNVWDVPVILRKLTGVLNMVKISW